MQYFELVVLDCMVHGTRYTVHGTLPRKMLRVGSCFSSIIGIQY